MIRPRIRLFSTDACSFCVRAKNLLTAKGVGFEEIHLPRHDIEARRALAALTGRVTMPQILIDDRPIGGWDDLKALEDAGRLDPLLGIA